MVDLVQTPGSQPLCSRQGSPMGGIQLVSDIHLHATAVVDRLGRMIAAKSARGLKVGEGAHSATHSTKQVTCTACKVSGLYQAIRKAKR